LLLFYVVLAFETITKWSLAMGKFFDVFARKLNRIKLQHILVQYSTSTLPSIL